MPRLLRRFLLVLALTLPATACGPAFRFRPANTLPRGVIELGAGVGAGARVADGRFGGGELQAWVRGGVDPRVEIGGRFFSSMLSSFGGAFEVRVAAVQGPFDLSVDLALVGGACCGAGKSSRTLAAALGFDAGFSVGKRFGGPRAVALYFAPHVQVSWTFPLEHDWPKQLYLPVGVDIPLGRSPLSLRPEVLAAGLFHTGGRMDWRLGGGIGLAVAGPGPKLAAAQRREKLRAAEEREDPAPSGE